jgi:RNA polymerase sigma-70 factor (ECF subfamily)
VPVTWSREERPVTTDPRFEELYRAEYGAVCRTVYLLSGDWGVAEEATQEAFARALVRWQRLGGEVWIGGWITTTALNVARRALRRTTAPAPSGPSDLVTEAAPDGLMDLHRIIRDLPDRQQEAALLYYVEDRPVSEIARAMGCREGTVKAHLDRARRALRRALQEAPAE